VIKSFALILVAVLFATSAAAQEASPVRCVTTLYRLNGEQWKLVKSLEFVPRLGEEELTNQRIRFPGTKVWLLAAVFPTDESMHSAKGADSIKLGLAFSRRNASSAFDIDNNAVAETTFAALDTLRVERTTYVARRPIMARLECWDPALEKAAN
jgi:hypothetical protein